MLRFFSSVFNSVKTVKTVDLLDMKVFAVVGVPYALVGAMCILEGRYGTGPRDNSLPGYGDSHVNDSLRQTKG